MFTVFSQYARWACFSHLTFKLPLGGFRFLASCSNSADLLPFYMLHWPLFSNSELSGTVRKQSILTAVLRFAIFTNYVLWP